VAGEQAVTLARLYVFTSDVPPGAALRDRGEAVISGDICGTEG
jgi:hypothetical protein